MKDILENQNKMPYSVPEGYFETLAERVVARVEKKHAGSAYRKLTPYISMAAMFALIAAGGTAVMKLSSPKEEFPEYADIFYYGPGPATEAVYSYYDYEEEEALTYDDIIEYLIYNGTEADYIAYNY